MMRSIRVAGGRRYVGSDQGAGAIALAQFYAKTGVRQCRIPKIDPL
jgi:hypothetical protein